MRQYLYATLPFLVAVALRLYPTLISGLPFSTDAWPLIRNTELIIEHTPIHLGNDKIFDGYNNYWPANSLFGAVISQVTGFQPMSSMAIYIPLAGATSILIFYVLVQRLYGPKTSFIASMIFATAYTHVIFTSGVTKETYANPLYLLLILMFLHPSIADWRRIILFSISSITLVSTHHYTTIITLVILLVIASANLIKNVRLGLNQRKIDFLCLNIFIVAAVLYYWLYASRGFPYTLSYSDGLSAASYQILVFAVAVYFVFKPQARIFIITLLTMMIALLIFTATRIPLVLGAPVLPHYYAMMSIAIIVFLVIAHGSIRSVNRLSYKKRRWLRNAPVFWFASILGFIFYAIFSNSDLAFTLLYRTSNFLWPSTAILCAAWIYSLNRISRKPFASMILLGIIVINFYSVYTAVSQQERYMGYFWRYNIAEYEAAEWTAMVAGNQAVAGDVKTSYLLKGYFNVNVEVLKGITYLAGKGSKPHLLLIYDQMLRNGYVVYGGYSVDLPENFRGRLYYLNLCYSNGPVDVYAG